MKGYGWFRGEVQAVVKGNASQRFFSLLLQKGIQCWCIENTEEYYTFRHYWKDCKTIQRYADKTGMEYTADQIRGLPHIWKHCRKRPWIPVGVFVVLLLAVGVYQLVWGIRITGNETITHYEIQQFLQEMDIKKGSWKKKVQPRILSEKLMSHFETLSFATVYWDANTLVVEVKERTEEPAMLYENDETGDLVAKEDSLIYSIVTEKGTPRVQKGDVVRKGDILISGYAQSMADDGTLTYTPVQAAGRVLGVRKYEFRDYQERNGEIREYQDTVQNALAFFCDTRQIYLWNPFSNTENYDIISSELFSLELFGKELQVYHEEYQAYETLHYEYTAEEMERLIKERLNYAAERWMAGKGYLEIERLWDFEQTENGMEGVLTIQIIEDISKSVPLESLPMEELQEENG